MNPPRMNRARVIEPGKIRPQLQVIASRPFATDQAALGYIDHQLEMGFACSRVRESGQYRVTVMEFCQP